MMLCLNREEREENNIFSGKKSEVPLDFLWVRREQSHGVVSLSSEWNHPPNVCHQLALGFRFLLPDSHFLVIPSCLYLKMPPALDSDLG